MKKHLAALTLLAACTRAAGPPQDPRCPEGWTFTVDNVGRCAAPDGFTALLYAQFGGSGIYGFGRLTGACTDPNGGVGCGVSMIDGMPVALYTEAQIAGNHVVPGSVPVLAVETGDSGVFKGPVAAGSYYIVVTDPDNGQEIVTGQTDVKPDTLALYAIDLDHSSE